MARVLAIAVLCHAPWMAHAQEAETTSAVARAEALAAEGYNAYRAGNYAESVTFYLKALDLSPSADILYNLAKIYDLRIRDRELAMRFYRRYVSDSGADPDRVRQVNKRLAMLRELELAAEPEAPRRPAAPTARGSQVDAQQSANARPVPGGRGAGMSTMRVIGIATAGIGLVSLGAGTAFALSARASLQDADCDGNVCQTPEDVRSVQDAAQAADVATVTTIAGLSLLAAGTVLFVWGAEGRPETAAATAGLAVHPVAGPGLLGSTVTGRW